MRTAVVLLGLLLGADHGPTETLVHTPEEFAAAVRVAQPGDTIVLADGTWTDAVLTFDADGIEGDTITVRAQTPGNVILNGTSRLRIGGSYLKVEGLWFHLGALERGHVVAFRTDRPAHHSRITECAITEYNPPDWLRQYKWLSLYGTHNRVDHCYLAGKTHDGATLVVWLEDPPNDAPNYHRIDHNHFGPRPRLGKNAGETIRIGTSARSMQNSYTLVEHNLFERTNGEHEIISNKTGRNTYRHNTFREAQGALTLRHGNEATVEANYFLGNGQPGTGGVRIIGEDHRVVGNYFEGLRGDSSRAALSIMNGIPDSPLNRYFQVKRALISGNTFADTRVSILYGLGADSEKPLRPENVRFEGNVIQPSAGASAITAFVPLDQIRWRDNVFGGKSLELPSVYGIVWTAAALRQESDGRWRPVPDGPAAGMGATMMLPPLDASQVGPAWWGSPWIPAVLTDSTRILPDFSYAGYHWGEAHLPDYVPTLSVSDYGATGDDTRDDTEAFRRAFGAAHVVDGLAVIDIPEGDYYLSGVLFVERDSLIIRGRGPDRTRIRIEKPLGGLNLPDSLAPPSSSNAVRGRPHSRFSEQGGYFWFRKADFQSTGPGVSVTATAGHSIAVTDSTHFDGSGDYHLSWTDKDGSQRFQAVTTLRREGVLVHTKEPLWEALAVEHKPMMTPVAYLREVGIEHLSVEFEPVPYSGHHLEDGYNAIDFSGVRQGWVRNVSIRHADAGVVFRNASQVTVDQLEISGRAGHVGIRLIDSQHILVRNVALNASAVHPLGCTGLGGRNVVTRGHMGPTIEDACVQGNLYDQITFRSSGDPLWDTTGLAVPVWWNCTVTYSAPDAMRLPAYLGYLGSRAMVIGLDSAVPVRMEEAAGAYSEGVNRRGLAIESLYAYQLKALDVR